MNRLRIFVFAIVQLASIDLIAQEISSVWLGVNSRHYDSNSWISSLDGEIFVFNSDTLRLGHVFSDTMITTKLDYINTSQLKISNIITSDIDTFNIYQRSQDSITLLLNNTMLLTLIPLNLQYTSNLELQELIHNSWSFVNSGFEYRIEFLNESGTYGYPDISKRCITNANVEIYSLYTFQNTQFITVTFGQTENYIYQITNIKNDTVYTKSYSKTGYIHPLFVKHKSIDQMEIDNIKSTLYGNWSTSELLSYGTGLEEFLGDSSEFEFMGWSPDDSTMITRSSLIEKKISYSFNDSTYQLLINNEKLLAGQYRISADGKFIVLNEGKNPNDYIELIELANDQLTIAKRDDFSVGNEGDYIEYFYKLRMIKRGTTMHK